MSGGKIHLVHHAEGLHNFLDDPKIPDPALTERGHDSADKMGRMFLDINPNTVGLIMTSPLRRTIETSLLAFSGLLDKKYYPIGSGEGVSGGIDLFISADLQETTDLPCHRGSDVQTLHTWFPSLDYTHLPKKWPAMARDFAPTPRAVKNRAARVRKTLQAKMASLPDPTRKDIIVVTHGGFIAALLQAPDIEIPLASWMSFVPRQNLNGDVVLLAA